MTKKTLIMVICSMVVLQLFVAGGALAGSVTYNASVSPATMTDWIQAISVPKYDASLFGGATLQSVDIKLKGLLSGDMRAENWAPSSTTITLTLSAVLQLHAPDNSVLVTTLPQITETPSVTGFDGTFDWQGTSGVQYIGLSGSKTETASFTAPATLALFTGTGNIACPVDAKGNSLALGSGNLVSWFTTLAAADVEVTYNYVPEPGSLLALGTGFIGLVGFVLRRKH